jgi:hypothetical protein
MFCFVVFLSMVRMMDECIGYVNVQIKTLIFKRIVVSFVVN